MTNHEVTLVGSYDHALVALSVAIAILAAQHLLVERRRDSNGLRHLVHALHRDVGLSASCSSRIRLAYQQKKTLRGHTRVTRTVTSRSLWIWISFYGWFIPLRAFGSRWFGCR